MYSILFYSILVNQEVFGPGPVIFAHGKNHRLSLDQQQHPPPPQLPQLCLQFNLPEALQEMSECHVTCVHLHAVSTERLQIQRNIMPSRRHHPGSLLQKLIRVYLHY